MLERVLKENTDAQANRLAFFLRLLDRLFDGIPAQGEDTVAYTLLLASILRIQQSARGVQLLATEGCVEEILVISRSMLEMTVNAVYLQHVDEREVEQYLTFHPELLHAHGALMTRRASAALGEVWQRIEQVLLLAGGRAQSFSTRGDPSWTPRTLLERAQFCDAASHAPILEPMVHRCYPRSHAALHGTAGSLESFITALTLGRPLGREDRLAELSDALFAVNLCLLTLALYLNHTFHLGMDESIDEAANADSISNASLEGRWNVA